MKNYLYQFIDALNTELRAAGFNCVTFGDAAEIDLNKQSLFPLTHIVIPDAVMQPKTTTFTLDMIVVDLVDFQKEYTETTNNTFNISNVQDVLQDLMSRVQHALLEVDDNQFINISFPVNFSGFKENFTNAVAGWTITINFVTPQMGDLCTNNL